MWQKRLENGGKDRGGNKHKDTERGGGVYSWYLGKKNFWTKFKYVKKKNTSTGLLALILAADDVGEGEEDSIYNLPPNSEGGFFYQWGPCCWIRCYGY